MTLAIGQRVRIKEGAFEFAGVAGTIELPPEGMFSIDTGCWIGPYKYQRRRGGVVLVYWVKFDEPADDGSGDGPYWGSQIAAEDLEPVEG